MVLFCARADEQNGTTYGSPSYFAIGYQINDSSGRKVSVKCNNDDLLQIKHQKHEVDSLFASEVRPQCPNTCYRGS